MAVGQRYVDDVRDERMADLAMRFERKDVAEYWAAIYAPLNNAPSETPGWNPKKRVPSLINTQPRVGVFSVDETIFLPPRFFHSG